MFDIGFAEILIVSVVALLVLGPEKLPTAVRTVGMWVGRIKRSLTSIQHEISEELRVEELRRTTAISKEELEAELKELQKPFKAAAKDVEKAATAAEQPVISDTEQQAPAQADRQADETGAGNKTS